jgi:hypothetical protein
MLLDENGENSIVYDLLILNFKFLKLNVGGVFVN